MTDVAWRGSKSLLPLLVPIESLRTDPHNARSHPIQNREAIRESLRAFGQQKPIVVTTDGMVIAGNGLLWAATELGWDKIAISHFEGHPIDAKAFALADNRTGELSIWNEEVLEQQLLELQAARVDVDLTELGFELPEEPKVSEPHEPGDGEPGDKKGPYPVVLMFDNEQDAKLATAGIQEFGSDRFTGRILDLVRALSDPD